MCTGQSLPGLRIVGVDQDGEARIVEVPEHRFFVGTLFVPQLNSTAEHPHPLIVAFMEEATVRERPSLKPTMPVHAGGGNDAHY